MSVRSSPKDRFRTLAFSKYLYLLVQTLLSCLLGHIPNAAVRGSLQAWVGAAVFCQLRACAHEPQGMQGPSPPSSFILPIHCSALFNHRDDAGNCFLSSKKHFMGLEKVYQYFSEGDFGSQ